MAVEGVELSLLYDPGRMTCTYRWWARQGFESVTSSVSESLDGSQRPAAGGGVSLLTWPDGGPVQTAVVRCDPVVRGPDVAPMWPQR